MVFELGRAVPGRRHLDKLGFELGVMVVEARRIPGEPSLFVTNGFPQDPSASHLALVPLRQVTACYI